MDGESHLSKFLQSSRFSVDAADQKLGRSVWNGLCRGVCSEFIDSIDSDRQRGKESPCPIE